MSLDLDIQVVDDAPLTAVLLHPHPGMGGDRFNHVVATLYRALPGAGFSALRFDFTSADPERAREQTEEALAAAGERAPGSPVALVGYSFGADVALTVTDAAVAGWVLLAPPLLAAEPPAGPDPRPKVLVVAERDQFSPPARVAAASAGWSNAEVTVVAGADHFLVGHGEAVEGLVASRLAGWVRAGADGGG